MGNKPFCSQGYLVTNSTNFVSKCLCQLVTRTEKSKFHFLNLSNFKKPVFSLVFLSTNTLYMKLITEKILTCSFININNVCMRTKIWS